MIDQKITRNPKIKEMMEHVIHEGMLYSYVDPHAEIFGGLSYANPDHLFTITLFNIDFKNIDVDLDKHEVTFLDVLKAIPYCKKVEFELCRPVEGVYKTLIIE